MSAALKLEGLTKSFGKTAVIMGVDLEIAKGERHAIIGPNGAGKSTLFNLITGRFPQSSGAVYLHGRNLLSCTLSNKSPRTVTFVSDHEYFSKDERF